MRHLRLLPLLFVSGLGLQAPVQAQLIFDWPIRSGVRPEAVLTGAEAVFWNPGSLAQAAGTHQEIRITHIDGPDATGVRGLALAGTVDLPAGLRAALGYWHLGIQDIPITTDSPAQDYGTLEVAEDVAVLGLARNAFSGSSVGGALNFQRGSAGGESVVALEGRVGLDVAPPLPLSPHLGLALAGLGQTPRLLAGMELRLPPQIRARIPLHLGYGIQRERGGRVAAHRLSLRGSWEEKIHLGFGLSHGGEDEGWTPLWTLGVELGRYSFSLLREDLANGFGAVHFYRAAVRFPASETR